MEDWWFYTPWVCVFVCMYTCRQTPWLEWLKARLEVRKRGSNCIISDFSRDCDTSCIFLLRNELLLHLKTYNLYYEGQNLQLRHREVRSHREGLGAPPLVASPVFVSWCVEFPSSPLVRTLPSNTEGAGSIPGQRAKTPHASGMKKPKCKTEGIL